MNGTITQVFFLYSSNSSYFAKLLSFLIMFGTKVIKTNDARIPQQALLWHNNAYAQ